MSRLDEIAEREKRATPGEWFSSDDAIEWSPKQMNSFVDRGAAIEPDIVVGGAQDEQGGAVGVIRNEDATFIAHARQDIPWLLSNIRAAIRHIDATLTEHAGDIPRGELVRAWDLLEGRAKTTEVSDGR